MSIPWVLRLYNSLLVRSLFYLSLQATTGTAIEMATEAGAFRINAGSQLCDVGWKIFALQHLGQVEELVDFEGILNAAPLCKTVRRLSLLSLPKNSEFLIHTRNNRQIMLPADGCKMMVEPGQIL